MVSYLTMMVCYELGKTEDEVGQWSLEDVTRWVAFLRLKNEAESEAIKKAREKANRSGGGNRTTY